MGKLYKTSWLFANRTDLDGQVYDMIARGMQETGVVPNRQLLFEYAAFLYLSGCRRCEPFLKSPTVSKFESGGRSFYKIVRANEKHFTNPKQACLECNAMLSGRKAKREHGQQTGHKKSKYVADRKTLTQIIFAENPSEEALFQFIMQGRIQRTFDFFALLPAKAQAALKVEPLNFKVVASGATILSRKFAKIFKANLSDGKEAFENAGPVPHMLRHARAYDLLVTHRLPISLVQRLLGWQTRDLVDRYADVSSGIESQEILEQYASILSSRR